MRNPSPFRSVTLLVDDTYDPPTLEESKAALAAVRGATQLTFLVLDFAASSMTHFAPRGLCLGAVLEGLVNLQHLRVDIDRIPQASTLKLTALSRLTALDLSGCGPGGVTDLVVSALACKLCRLRSLALNWCGMMSQAFLPAVGTLTDLQHLEFSDSQLVVTNDGSRQLSGLTQLTWLTVSEASQLSDAAKQSLVQGLPCLVTHNLVTHAGAAT